MVGTSHVPRIAPHRGGRRLLTGGLTAAVVIAAAALPGTASAAPVQIPDDLTPNEEIRVSFPQGHMRIGTRNYRFSDAEIGQTALIGTFSGGTIKFAFRNEEPSGAVFARLDDGRRFRGANVRVTLQEKRGRVRAVGKLTNAKTGRTIPLRMTLPLKVVGGGSAQIWVRDGKAYIAGSLGPRTTKKVRALIKRHPTVRTLVLMFVPGSVDDEANQVTSRLLRKYRFTTVLPKNGLAASGGVDLFSAGRTRIAEPGGRLGVHSWAESVSGIEGRDLPRRHPAHRPFIRFSRQMLGNKGTAFYFFTLKAAPASDIHFMTRAEMKRFRLITGSELRDAA